MDLDRIKEYAIPAQSLEGKSLVVGRIIKATESLGRYALALSGTPYFIETLTLERDDFDLVKEIFGASSQEQLKQREVIIIYQTPTKTTYSVKGIIPVTKELHS